MKSFNSATTLPLLLLLTSILSFGFMACDNEQDKPHHTTPPRSIYADSVLQAAADYDSLLFICTLLPSGLDGNYQRVVPMVPRSITLKLDSLVKGDFYSDSAGVDSVIVMDLIAQGDTLYKWKESDERFNREYYALYHRSIETVPRLFGVNFINIYGIDSQGASHNLSPSINAILSLPVINWGVAPSDPKTFKIQAVIHYYQYQRSRGRALDDRLIYDHDYNEAPGFYPSELPPQFSLRMKKATAVGYTKLRCILEFVGGRQLVSEMPLPQ
jgi:lipoprotein